MSTKGGTKLTKTVLLTSYHNIALTGNLIHLPVPGWVVFAKLLSNQ